LPIGKLQHIVSADFPPSDIGLCAKKIVYWKVKVIAPLYPKTSKKV